MQRIAITGSSGYLGRKLVESFQASGSTVWGLDIRAPEPDATGNPDQFCHLDICDPGLADHLADFDPDVLIHGAFAFKPIRDEEKMRRINIEGTKNVLAAAEKLQIQKLLIVSSATAYGAWPDNPVPMDETWPLRARSEFRYAADKTEVEALFEIFAKENPAVTASLVRPAIIAGPGFDNYLSRFIFGMPFLVALDGKDTAMQFVHESDVVSAIEIVLQKDGRGAFNVGPPDWTTVREVARLTKRWTVRWPFWFAKFLHGMAWTLRVPIHESPAGFLYFARYPWVVTPQRLQKELGYEFKYSCQDTLAEIIANSK